MEFKKNRNYKFIKCDISNKKNIANFKKEKPKALFNLAAETHVDRSIDSPYPFMKSNILGVFNLLESVRNYFKLNKKFRFIHISTDEVYGDIKKVGLKKIMHTILHLHTLLQKLLLII